MRHAFDSPEAKQLNKDIRKRFIMLLLLPQRICIENGPPMKLERLSYIRGCLQFDMWKVKPSDRWEWDLLREEGKSTE